MKLFYVMIAAALIGAIALPFFIKGPDGKPIVTMDKMIDDTAADIVPQKPVEMYRWQNEHGIWQFGEAPPEQVVATQLKVDTSHTTTMGAEWVVSPVIIEARTGEAPANFQMPNSLSDAYRAAPELMNAAKRAATVLNDRQSGMDEQLDELMQTLQ